MPVRRRKKVVINQPLIIDSVIAALLVQKAPDLIASFLPVPLENPMIKTIAGAGVGYLAGMLSGRADMSNVSIGLGIVELVSPYIDNALASITETVTETITGGNGNGGGNQSKGALGPPILQYDNKNRVDSMGDYLSLNDYVSVPHQMNYNDYNDSY